jgi:5-methylcytosine-specific restriction protein A
MDRLPVLELGVRLLRTQKIELGPRPAAPELLTPAHRAWRTAIIGRAGGRCEWREGGFRCSKAEPRHRMFADHITERSDGGALLDLSNGQCLCGRHHTMKTMRARADRR